MDFRPHVADPVKFYKWLWPKVTLYRQQEDIMYSVRDNFITVVPAGNMLGKDFVSSIVGLWFFLTRHPCRVVTTSADGPQLEAVLWGEIRERINTARYQLNHDKGGPLVVNHLHIRKYLRGQVDGLSYMMGRVAAKGEGLLGHHIAAQNDGIPRTLMIIDEASGVDDKAFEAAETWAKRILIIGNPYPCTNFFKRLVKAGDVPVPDDVPGSPVQ